MWMSEVMRGFRPGGQDRGTMRAVAIAGAGLLALLSVIGCGRHAGGGPAVAAAIDVTTVPAEEVAWPGRIEAPASVAPLRRATPGTVLMGRVDQVLHREGDRVAAGAVLARVESGDVAARLAQAEAQVVAARAMAENARLTRERTGRLASRDAASKKSLDDAQAGYETAMANLNAAEEGVKSAKVYVAHAEVTSPFAGVVAEKRVEVGDTAAPGMPLFVVEDLSKVKIEAAVPESALAGLSPGDPVEVEIDAAGGARRGTLAQVLPAGDPRSRTFTVRVLLDNADGALRSGMFARLVIPGKVGKAIAVPESAVVRQGPLNGLFVVEEGGVARLRWVTLGTSRESRVEILTGLSAGERVVVDPPADLFDGRPVRVI